ncbi:hypothetical protein C8R44DRAFT_881791 [Mycena epipterygia]|nr:hypothetical protein C8R44DRAFT_881791 [Mycena epipterygia]
MSGGSQAPQFAPLARNVQREPLVRYINVHATPHIKGKDYTRIGSISRAYKETFGFEEMMEDILKCWMPAWDAIHNASLHRSEVSLLWHNKVNLEGNSTGGTLGELYDVHSQLYNGEVFLRTPSKLKGAVKEPAMAFLFVIDMDAYKARTETKKSRGTVVSKRRAPGEPDDHPQAKRHATAGLESIPLISNYIGLKAPAKAIRTATKVELEFVQLTGSSGNIVFPWAGAVTVTGRLCDEAMQTGKDKVAYELELNGELYVAKRCRRAPTDAASLFANEWVLRANQLALWNTKHILAKFYTAAEDADIIGDVDNCLTVLDTFLATEIISAERPPSVASGISAESVKAAVAEAEDDPDLVNPAGDDAGPPRILWQIQRRLGNLNDRWNVTKLANPRNKFGTTVAALCHFFATMVSVGKSPSEIPLLSHLQTINGKLPSSTYGKLIFDVIFQNDMHGNPRRAMDCGLKGAASVMNEHECNRLCDLLNLEADDEHSGGEKDDSDGEQSE